MRFFLLPLLLATSAMAANMGMSLHGNAYNFGYATGDAGGHSRAESGSGGAVAGSYSYIDANGDQRTVHYTAGPDGFKASGDTGVDRKTAAAAAAMAALAPKAPPAAAPIAPVAAPVYHNAFLPYGAYNPYAYAHSNGYVAHW
ncbi:adult-specific rigid cuticular protein 12.6-like [Uloborus diversus]|uniref:adult-specific rigid cuticular protein 12.6-like n=1 Tax=Uloborus diversus TaxID=327109 RepID=UPI002409F933|nr:adult-specific rigid cuticular protein 12.6-like [Uloborus diversus]